MGQKNKLPVLGVRLNGRLNNALFNIRKLTLNFSVVILVLILTSYSFSASSEENGIQSESKIAPTISLTERLEEALTRYRKMLNDDQEPTKADLDEAQNLIDSLEKEIEEDRQQRFPQMPRRLFVGARTKNYQAALYMETWRQKVEKVGNENYPKAAAEEHVYGNVRATVSILDDGAVEKVEIDKSSGHKILDDHVLDTISKAAPYEKFSDELKKYCDIISITRTWAFTQEDVETEGDVSTKPAKDDIGGK